MGKRLYCSPATIVELPHDCFEGHPIDFEVTLTEEMRRVGSGNEYLVLTMMGHVLSNSQ